MMNQHIRIFVLLGMVAVMCGTVSAGVGIIAETRDISGADTPVCSGGCECIAEATAAMRWGAEGYERCSKTICGQSADAMVQYYCFRPAGGVTSASLATCEAPCECLTENSAVAKWGTNGYSQCSKTVCSRDETGGGVVPLYCFRPWGSTLVIGGAATTAPAAAATTAPAAGAVATVQAPAEAPAPAGAAPAAPSPSYTWPSAGAVPQRTPVGTATILAAVGIVLLAAAMRKE